MATREHQTLHAPVGVASYADPASLPDNYAQAMQGFVPARLGTLRLAYALKNWSAPFAFNVNGMAVYADPAGVNTSLLIFSGTNIYAFNLIGVPTYYTFQQKIHALIAGSGTPSLKSSSGPNTATQLGIRACQFGTELIVTTPGTQGGAFRIYIDGFGFHIFNLGLPTPPAPTLVGPQAFVGGLTVGATYQYVAVWVDEKGRESSISLPVTTGVITAGNTAMELNIPAGVTGGITGITQWGLYRKNPGSSVYQFVAYIPVATLTYTDQFPDSTIDLNAASTSPGENDPPTNFNAMCIWKDRMVLNNRDLSNLSNWDQIQISNGGSPTQYSSLALPTNLNDGIRTEVKSLFGDAVVGLRSFGSVLLIFKERTTFSLWGDDITSFAVRQVHERGCRNADSIQHVNDRVFAYLEDGLYSFGATATGYGILMEQKETLPLEDYFRGFAPKQNPFLGDPLQQLSVESISAFDGYVQSWWHSNRYYLSLLGKTWVFDLETNGWSDTGYGMARASAYVSVNGIPETVFLSIGSQSAYSPLLSYFSATDQPDDKDYPVSVTSRLVTRPFDSGGQGQEAMRARRKQAVLYQCYGSAPITQKRAKGSSRPIQAGTITLHTDAGYSEGPYPIRIYAGPTANYPAGVLFQQGFLPSAQGRLIWVELNLTLPDITITDQIMEYVVWS